MTRGQLCKRGLHDDWYVGKKSTYCHPCKKARQKVNNRVRLNPTAKATKKPNNESRLYPTFNGKNDFTNRQWAALEQKLEMFMYGQTTEEISHR